MRIGQVVRGIAALIATVGLVVGGAVLLGRFGRLDAIVHLSIDEMFTGRDDGSFALGVITVLGWIAWGLLVLSFVADLVAVTTRRGRGLKVPGVAWFHPLTMVLVAAIVAMIQPAVPSVAAPSAPTLDATSATPSTATPVAEERMSHHVVEPGDDLWSLAQRYYGDGASWRRIAQANQTVLLHDTDHLTPGMVLAIPDPQPPTHTTVVEGDTLSALAETHLGNADQWPRIAAVNPQLEDPDELTIGMVLSLPDASGSMTTDPQPEPQPPSTTNDAPTSIDEPAGDQNQSTSQAERSTQTSVPGLPTAQSPFETCPVPDRVTDQQLSVSGSVLPITLGASVMAGLAGAFALRRSRQLMGRPVGHRLPVLGERAAAEQARLAALTVEEPRMSLTGARVELGPGVERDLLADGLTILSGPDGLDVDMANAIATDLAANLPDRNAEVVCAGPGFAWLSSLDEPLVEICPFDQAVRRLETELEFRDVALTSDAGEPDDLPTLILIIQGTHPMPPAERLAAHRIGVVQCVGTETTASDGKRVLIGDDEARHDDVPGLFRPTLLSPPARRVLAEIFETVTSTEYPTADWWDGTEPVQAAGLPLWNPTPHQPEVSSVPRQATAHPVVNLLGPIELTGARGQTPSRATKQCIEYAAWILEHPGATSLTMANSLVVAETTRRSNMSRLRTWLGNDDNGNPYLPEAYSGRIMLHPAVTSDWEQLRILVSGGVNRSSSSALQRGLELVRGAPLADAAPGQWVWAEQLRLDMIAMITDMAVVLARRSLELGELDTAAWAIERGVVANPDDESLLAVSLLLAARSGDQQQVDALVLQITRRARMLGVDLQPQTVLVLQEVVEGRRRASAVS